MVLSRFWLTIFISSIVFIIVSLFAGNTYSVDYVLNGKKDGEKPMDKRKRQAVTVPTNEMTTPESVEKINKKI